MNNLFVTFLGLLLLGSNAFGKEHFWWMNDPGVFGNNGNGGGAASPNNNLIQKQPTQQVAVNQPTKQNKYPNFPSGTQQQSSSPAIQSECPAGTKCVQEYFCDENAIMVSYRVSLTAAQKQKRGKLPTCVNGNDGKIDVCCSTVIASQPLNQQPPRNQQQNQVEAVVPVNVPSNNNGGAIPLPTGTCPEIGELPNIDACQGKNSTCWSVDLPDVDCVDNALCCFDGCVNACFYGDRAQPGGGDPPALNTPAPVTQPPPTQPPQPAPQPTVAPRTPGQNPRRRPLPRPVVPPLNNSIKKVFTQVLGGAGGGGGSRNNNNNNFLPNNNNGGVSGSYQGPLAESKPFVTCPSAMLCIPRQNCDLKGFITERTLNLSPQLEMLRVPLIPCVNPNNQNIDVCCRDPNYVDPWPQGMMMPMKASGNNGNGQKQQLNINPRQQQRPRW